MVPASDLMVTFDLSARCIYGSDRTACASLIRIIPGEIAKFLMHLHRIVKAYQESIALVPRTSFGQHVRYQLI